MHRGSKIRCRVGRELFQKSINDPRPRLFLVGNLTSRSLESQLIEREYFTTSFQYTNTSTLGESKCTDGQLWYVEKSESGQIGC